MCTCTQASFLIERLRYFVFEIPEERWLLNLDNLSHLPVLQWDAEEYQRPWYKGPLGQFYYSSLDETKINLGFQVKVGLPGFPTFLWETSIMSLDLARDVDKVRSEVVARMSLEKDSPIQLRYPNDAHELSDDSLPH